MSLISGDRIVRLDCAGAGSGAGQPVRPRCWHAEGIRGARPVRYQSREVGKAADRDKLRHQPDADEEELPPRCGSPLPPPCRRGRQTEEHQEGAVQAHQILVAQAADAGTQFRLRNGGDLVHHEAAGLAQAVPLVRCDEQAEQRCLRRIGGKGAEGDRGGGVEAIVQISPRLMHRRAPKQHR